MMQIVWIAVGGAIGSVCRYLMNVMAVEFFDSKFPFATLFVNATGSFLIGFLWNIAPQFSDQTRALIFVGLLGGFTTFSSFSLETVQLFEAGEAGWAIFNILLHTVIGIGLCFAGISISKVIF